MLCLCVWGTTRALSDVVVCSCSMCCRRRRRAGRLRCLHWCFARGAGSGSGLQMWPQRHHDPGVRAQGRSCRGGCCRHQRCRSLVVRPPPRRADVRRPGLCPALHASMCPLGSCAVRAAGHSGTRHGAGALCPMRRGDSENVTSCLGCCMLFDRYDCVLQRSPAP